MGEIVIQNLNKGIDVKNDPSVISEDSLADCVGFELSVEGSLETAKGLADHDLGADIPAGTCNWAEIAYIGSQRYILVSTNTGLYANGILITSDIKGRFSAVSFLNNIYITGCGYSKRFDGTNCYQWGISWPTSLPTIARGAYLERSYEDFEALADWTANQQDCTVSAEATIKKEGTQSAKFTVASGTLGYSYRAIAGDFTTFDTGESASEKDYIALWVRVDNLINLNELAIFFDTGDGTFRSDYFSYSIVSPGVERTLNEYGVGKTTEIVTEETTTDSYDYSWDYDYYSHPYAGPENPEAYTYAPREITKTITKNITKTLIDPVLADQVLSFWRRSSLFELKSNSWLLAKIPKNKFVQNGDDTKTWADVVAIKIEISTNDTGSVNVYLDDLRMIGGSDLEGDYWFTYAYARLDTNGNVLHESPPARSGNQVLISSPVWFDRHPISYANRPLSTDPQVNGGVIYYIGGNLTDFYELVTIEDNTTAADTLAGEYGESYVNRRMVTTHNDPAPTGSDLVVFENKIWMVGLDDHPMFIRSSDILADGTIAPEAWPYRNGYDLEYNFGPLMHISVLNQQLSVKGAYGEWLIRVIDPIDYLQVSARKISDNGLMAQDGVLEFGMSHVYPSSGGFVETNGQSSTFVLPQVEPIITDFIASAQAANLGLVSYFSYKHPTYGTRTAKVDLYRGQPRFNNLNDILVDRIFIEPRTLTPYVVLNGSVYILDSGYTNESIPGKELNAFLKSRTYRANSSLAWIEMSFGHNTGGDWFILKVYVNGSLVTHFPFRSTSRTREYFKFGPCEGEEFYFTIESSYGYRNRGIIYLPIKVYHNGQ